MHPSDVLLQGKHSPVSLPVCVHYAGSEKLMRESWPGRFRHPAALRTKLAITAVCRAYRKITSHNARTEIGNFSGVADDALVASQTLGYGWMWRIHSDQIAPIVKAFAPAVDEAEDAITRLPAAQSAGWGRFSTKQSCMTAPANAMTGPFCKEQNKAGNDCRKRQVP